MTMGNTIAYYRKQHALTQEALAQELDITNQAVSKWESDQSCPDVMLLPRLADIFDITIDELFGREHRGSCKEQTEMPAPDCLPWADDGVLRVVAYEGRKMICGGEAAKDFTLEHREDVRKILSAVNVICGNVEGDVCSGMNVNCADVGGDVDAGMSVNCGNVDGSVDAGAGVSCGNVGGDVDAGGNVTSGNVGGDVDAGGNVRCGSVAGDVEAGGKVQIG